MAKAKKPRGGSWNSWKKETKDITDPNQRITKILALAKAKGFSLSHADVEAQMSKKGVELPDDLKASIKGLVMKAVAAKVEKADFMSAVSESFKGSAKAKTLFDDLPLELLKEMIAAREK